MFCLDTNVIVFALNRRRPAVRERFKAEQAAGSAMFVSPLVLFELEYGLANSDRADESRAVLDTFLASFDSPPFDAADAREAGAIRGALERLGTPIGPYDLLIAAQARRRGAVLVTANRREFERVPGLMVTDWG